ncbi:MAG: ABC transporter ATP-binding protein [Christensenellales bacterium]|jgi:ABC-type lipoprotein export system ATPase subunit
MIHCDNLVKIYKTADIEVVALQGLDLTVEQGELMAIIGNSGSGKSTLMNMLGALDKPSAGALTVAGQDLLKFDQRKTVKYQRETVGFVWQNNARNLLPYMTALENVEVPMMISGTAKRAKARELLEIVGMSHRAKSKLTQLSGGEQQRVALAIAMANSPQVLLADEPTGAVDTSTGQQILSAMRRINRELGTTIVIVTHDIGLQHSVDRVVAIRDGRTSSEFVRRRSYMDELESVESLYDRTAQVESSHVELVVMDSAGRVQIPREHLDRLGIHGRTRLKVSFNEGEVVISKPEDGA